ncbi:MAG: hypothetical protein QXQ90_07850 [Desulfurococcaceae archaeon]
MVALTEPAEAAMSAKQRGFREVKVDQRLLTDLMVAVFSIENTLHEAGPVNLRVPLVYALSFAVPGSDIELHAELGASAPYDAVATMRHPETGDIVAIIPWYGVYLGGGKAYVDPRLGVAEKEFDELLHSVANALHTLVSVGLDYAQRKLLEIRSKSTGRSGELVEALERLRRTLQREGRRLLKHNPSPAPGLAAKLEELLSEMVSPGELVAKYRVTAPGSMRLLPAPELRTLVSKLDEYNDVTMRLYRTLKGSQREYWLTAEVSAETRFASRTWGNELYLRSTIVGVLRGFTCREDSCAGEAEVKTSWGAWPYMSSLKRLVRVPPSPAIVEKHVKVVADWRRTLSRAIELSSKAEDGSDERRLSVAPYLHEFWRELLEHGYWEQVVVEP